MTSHPLLHSNFGGWPFGMIDGLPPVRLQTSDLLQIWPLPMGVGKKEKKR